MKHTIFEFSLRLPAEEAVQLKGLVTTKLQQIESVDKVEFTANSGQEELRVYASFEDAESAVRLHQRIMRTIMRVEGVAIAGATSHLDDIFD